MCVLNLHAPEEFSPPRLIRSSLYHYDFTRIVDPAGKQPKRSYLRNRPSSSASNVNATAWWTRSRKSEYLSPLDVNNTSLLHFVDQQGFMQGTALCDSMQKGAQKSRATLLADVGKAGSSLAVALATKVHVLDDVAATAREHAAVLLWAVFSLVAASWLAQAIWFA